MFENIKYNIKYKNCLPFESFAFILQSNFKL